MRPTPALYALGTCLLAATVLAGAATPSWFEARTSGAQTLTLRGTATFGSVSGGGPFVITLGAASSSGAVVLTRRNGIRPGPGVYRLGSDSSSAIQALVVTGSPTKPGGAFHARGGRLTITHSFENYMAGHFEIDAAGFEATDPGTENRPLQVRGTFTALP